MVFPKYFKITSMNVRIRIKFSLECYKLYYMETNFFISLIHFNEELKYYNLLNWVHKQVRIPKYLRDKNSWSFTRRLSLYRRYVELGPLVDIFWMSMSRRCTMEHLWLARYTQIKNTHFEQKLTTIFIKFIPFWEHTRNTVQYSILIQKSFLFLR